jgi:hypothetical protein
MSFLQRLPFLERLLPKVAVLSDDVRAELVADSLLLVDEHLNGTITFTDPPTRGKRPVVRRVSIRGAIAVSHHRVVVWVQTGAYIDIRRRDAQKLLDVTAGRGKLLCIAFDAKDLDKTKSGRVDLRLRTPNAPLYFELLTGSSAG